MLKSIFFAAIVLALTPVHPSWAQVPDVNSPQNLASRPPDRLWGEDSSCPPVQIDRLLSLADAIRQAICANPTVQQAWADVRAQAAEVGISEAAYLPTLNATAGVERDTLATTYDASALGGSSISTSQNSSSRYGELNLTWVLFDFGKRNAKLQEARELLSAANATRDIILQAVFFNTAQAYYDLSDAQASVVAAQETERIAKDSLDEAVARHEAGVGSLSDQLQAQTNYRRAVLDRVSGEGSAKSAAGVLAVEMGLAVNTGIRVATSEPANATDFERDLNELIEEAKARHPSLVAARARLDAARANLDAIRAEDRPTLSLVGNLSENNPSFQQQPQQLPITHSHGSTIGIQLTIPLFEGFGSAYRIAQAKAQADAQDANLRNTESQVSLEVWKGYESLQINTTNLANSKELLSDAQKSLDVERGRYREGVGTIVELLNAQKALEDARQQRVLALSKWQISRLMLARSLGTLGFLAE